MPERWPEAVAAADVGHRLGSVDHERIVVLGGGPARGIAAEWCLKLTETSQVATEAYEPLEFRHGPISVCEPGVLVVGLIGGPGAQEEARVLREAGGLGAETWLIGREADDDRGLAGWISLVGQRAPPVGAAAAARLPGPRPGAHPGPRPRPRSRTRRAISARWSSSTRRDPAGRLPAPVGSARAGSRGPPAAVRGDRRPQPSRAGVRRRVGRRARSTSSWRSSTRRASRRLVDLDGGGRRPAVARRSTAGRRGRPTGSSCSPVSTTTAGPADAAFGETEARAPARLGRPGGARAQGLEDPRAAGARPAREAGRGRRRATRPALGDGRRARPPGRHPHRRSDRLLPTARPHERALRGADRAPRLALLADAAAGPTRRSRVPAVRRAPGGVRPARRAASRDDVRRGPRRLRGRGPRAGLADARRPPEPLRRHRGAARASSDASRTRPGRSSSATPTGSCSGPMHPRTPAVYRLHYRFLETLGRVVRLLDRRRSPAQGRWQIHGLGLPDDVLRAIYRENAVRVLRLDRGRARSRRRERHAPGRDERLRLPGLGAGVLPGRAPRRGPPPLVRRAADRLRAQQHVLPPADRVGDPAAGWPGRPSRSGSSSRPSGAGACGRCSATTRPRASAWLTRPLDLFGERLGCVLYRVPGDVARTEERHDRLARLLDLWPPRFPLTMEFQHGTWHVDETFELLRAHGAVLCATDLDEMDGAAVRPGHRAVPLPPPAADGLHGRRPRRVGGADQPVPRRGPRRLRLLPPRRNRDLAGPGDRPGGAAQPRAVMTTGRPATTRPGRTRPGSRGAR